MSVEWHHNHPSVLKAFATTTTTTTVTSTFQRHQWSLWSALAKANLSAREVASSPPTKSSSLVSQVAPLQFYTQHLSEIKRVFAMCDTNRYHYSHQENIKRSSCELWFITDKQTLASQFSLRSLAFHIINALAASRHMPVGHCFVWTRLMIVVLVAFSLRRQTSLRTNLNEWPSLSKFKSVNADNEASFQSWAACLLNDRDGMVVCIVQEIQSYNSIGMATLLGTIVSIHTISKFNVHLLANFQRL